jgi:hypothetical protein
LPQAWPLLLYGRYEIREILTAVGWLTESRRQPHQSGKIALDEERIELLFVTLDKSTGYHDRISYHDYAISPELFHWIVGETREQRLPGHAGRAALHREPGERLALLPLREGEEGGGVLRHRAGNQGAHRGRSADVAALEVGSGAADGVVPGV